MEYNKTKFYMADNIMRDTLDYCCSTTDSTGKVVASNDSNWTTIAAYATDSDLRVLKDKVLELEEKIAAVLPERIGYKRASAFNIDKWKYEIL